MTNFANLPANSIARYIKCSQCDWQAKVLTEVLTKLVSNGFANDGIYIAYYIKVRKSRAVRTESFRQIIAIIYKSRGSRENQTRISCARQLFAMNPGKRRNGLVETAQIDDGGKNRKKSRVDDGSIFSSIQKSPSSNPSSSDIPLPQLLDLSSLNHISDISNRFDQLANALLYNFRLTLTCADIQTQFEILEMEFYFHKFDCHEDPFTHDSEEQKTTGRW
jgi:hypothetical protein